MKRRFSALDSGGRPINIVMNRPCSSGTGHGIIAAVAAIPTRRIRTALECGFTVGLGINHLVMGSMEP